MRRVFINKWFILASLLTISFSAFSFMSYQNTGGECNLSRQCTPNKNKGIEKSDLLWDIFTRQFPSVSLK